SLEGAMLVRTLLERVETLTVLVTSRRRLELPGEQEFPVGPLPVPGVQVFGCSGVQDRAERPLEELNTRDPRQTAPAVPPDHLNTYPSVRLFVDRAQAGRADFQLTPGNAAAIAGLCQRLEGIPLAIELAAARATVLTPQQMLSRLAHRFELLVGR